MFFRYGILFSFFAVFLQIAVFLQPLLPEQFQISPVCETITRALFTPVSTHQYDQNHSHHQQDHDKQHKYDNHRLSIESSVHSHDHHDPNHQCQYCTVYANLVLPPVLGIQEVFERIQVRLLFFKQEFAHVYFVLQKLFLIPQGRAPPYSL